MKPAVRMFDTTLRDGEQTPGVHFTTPEKIEIARALERLGVSTIEAGFPISSPGDAEAVAQVAAQVRECEVAALARCVAADIDAAGNALQHAVAPVIHVVLGTSDIHLQHKLRMTRTQAVDTIDRAVRHARQRAAAVEFSLEDATRTDPIFLRQCVQTAVAAGATRINLADTVGCALPEEYGAMIQDVVRFTEGEVIVSAHCHNDMGLATANSVAAVQHGARQVEVTINGIGERAGNTALEEVTVVLRMKHIAQSGIRLEQVQEVSARVAEASGIAVQPNRAVVGANAFTHSSGIHQDGILKQPGNYEFVPPQLVGVPGHRFVLTARSGRSAVAEVVRRAGVCLTPQEMDSVYRTFLQEADRARGAVADEVVVALARQAAQPVGVVA